MKLADLLKINALSFAPIFTYLAKKEKKKYTPQSYNVTISDEDEWMTNDFVYYTSVSTTTRFHGNHPRHNPDVT